jgi:cell wall-associated NlpC family hydrolase
MICFLNQPLTHVMMEGVIIMKGENRLKKKTLVLLTGIVLSGIIWPIHAAQAFSYWHPFLDDDRGGGVQSEVWRSPLYSMPDWTQFERIRPNEDGFIRRNRSDSSDRGTVPTAQPNRTLETAAPLNETNADAEAVIQTGLKYLGTPYEFGSDRSNPSTFDCSDFVKHIFKEALNVELPSDSRKQGAYVREHGEVATDWTALKRGDLMFFMSYKGADRSDYASKSPFADRITHVGVYLGNGDILHTYSKESGGVRVDRIAGTAWEYRFLFGGSALP